MTDTTDGSDAPDDDSLPLSITHSRDTIVFGGKTEQDYRFLVYRFKGDAGEISARMYFDDPWSVSVFPVSADAPVDAPILDYLKRRFSRIQEFGGPEGYTVIWEKND
jgi:hypothetical protein